MSDGFNAIETCLAVWRVVCIRNRYFSVTFSWIDTKLFHHLEKTFPQLACARLDDSIRFFGNFEPKNWNNFFFGK